MPTSVQGIAVPSQNSSVNEAERQRQIERMSQVYRLSSGDTFRVNYPQLSQDMFAAYYPTWIDKDTEPKVIGNADEMIDTLQQAICSLRAELAGVRALREWEEERLQEKERESWMTC